MGAWDIYYSKKIPVAVGDPLGFAVIAIKRELAYNGFVGTMNLDTPVIGTQADKQIRRFQKLNALLADGVVGPLTARALFRKRARDVQSLFGVPDDLICKLKTLESANDPGAVGVVDPDDHGLVQINVRIHQIPVEQAIDPSYCLPRAGVHVSSFARDNAGDWDAAVASWNIGSGGARSWLSMGKPSTGGPSWSPELYARATKYVKLIRGQAC